MPRLRDPSAALDELVSIRMSSALLGDIDDLARDMAPGGATRQVAARAALEAGVKVLRGGAAQNDLAELLAKVEALPELLAAAVEARLLARVTDEQANPRPRAEWPETTGRTNVSNVNKVILVGNLGADPETRSTQGGQTVCNFRIATSEAWNDRDGARQERTEWHHITVWGKQAESCGQYLTKGRTVYVEGRLQSREYDDKEGVKRKVWEVIADKVVFIGGNDRGAAAETHAERKGYEAPRQQPRAEAPKRPAGGSRPIAPPPGDDFGDEPLPF